MKSITVEFLAFYKLQYEIVQDIDNGNNSLKMDCQEEG
jgi:hypothetical protein